MEAVEEVGVVDADALAGGDAGQGSGDGDRVGGPPGVLLGADEAPHGAVARVGEVVGANPVQVERNTGVAGEGQADDGPLEGLLHAHGAPPGSG